MRQQLIHVVYNYWLKAGWSCSIEQILRKSGAVIFGDHLVEIEFVISRTDLG